MGGNFQVRCAAILKSKRDLRIIEVIDGNWSFFHCMDVNIVSR